MNACARSTYILGLLFAFSAIAASDEPSASDSNTEQSPMSDGGEDMQLTSRSTPGALGENYKPPARDRKKSRATMYPQQLMASGREGWVVVNMMVSPQGEPYAIGVVESSDSAFEKAALDGANAMRFTAGMLNGVPVDSAYALKFRFSTEADGASAKFIRQFRKFEQSIRSDDKAAADEALQKLKFQNLYEEAFYHLGRFIYFRYWGDEQEQLNALQKAIAYEKKSRYLPPNYFQFALAEIFRLQVKTLDFGGALETYESFESKMKKNPDIVNAVERIKSFSTNDEAYSVHGEIPKDHSWNFRLLKRQFTFLVSRGRIEEIKLRCEANYVLVRYKPDFEYTLPKDYGACSMEVVGDSGTTFTLIQS